MEYSYTHGKTLQTGEEIRNFQYKLNAIRDIFHCPWSHLTTDGVFGRKTRDAVKAFQIFANVSPVTGNLDSNTQRAIDAKYRESQRTYSSVKKQIDNYQYTDALYTEGGVFLQEFLQESSAVVDEIWDSNKAQLESISKDVIDIITAIVSDRSQQSLNNKFQARQGEIQKLWREYSDIMNRIKPNSWSSLSFNNLDSVYKASTESVDLERGQLFRRRADRGPSMAKILKGEADKKLRQTIETINDIPVNENQLKNVARAKALSKVGYGIPVLDMFYHGSKYLFAEGPADTAKCKKEFEKSLENGLGTVAVGIATDLGAKLATGVAVRAAGGAAGGPVGIAVVVVVSVLDIILVSTTGKSLSDRLVQLLKEAIKEYPWREYANTRKDVPHPLI